MHKNILLMGIIALFSGYFAHASTEIVYGPRSVIGDGYDNDFKALLQDALGADARAEGFADVLDSYRFVAKKVKTLKWDGEYTVNMTLEGRNPDMYDDGVFVKIDLELYFSPRINEFEITNKTIRILKK